MQGTHRSGRGKGRIQALGFLERSGVDGLNGIQARPLLVVSLDAIEIEVYQFAARKPRGYPQSSLPKDEKLPGSPGPVAPEPLRGRRQRSESQVERSLSILSRAFDASS